MLMEAMSQRQSRRISSAKPRWLIPKAWHLGWKLKPECWVVLFSNLEKYFMQIMKR
jgi:hypothetical protein